jgi:hypothetical protein
VIPEDNLDTSVGSRDGKWKRMIKTAKRQKVSSYFFQADNLQR